MGREAESTRERERAKARKTLRKEKPSQDFEKAFPRAWRVWAIVVLAITLNETRRFCKIWLGWHLFWYQLIRVMSNTCEVPTNGFWVQGQAFYLS